MSKSITVFIIDDDDDDTEMFSEVIKDISCSFICLTASTGHDALHKLQEMNTLPDFIFLDLNMPRMNGRQCLVQLKKNERLSSIPVIIYSTSKLDTDREETQKSGAVYFLTKPTSAQQLKKELQFVLGKKYENSASI